jgi:hypothetical protein
LANNYDLSHSHGAFNAQCNIAAGNPSTCRMNGAAGVGCKPKAGTTCPANPPFKYVDNASGILNPYLTLATQYGWANYMFQTNQGPSFPAHQFIFGGTSAPSRTDDANGIFSSENMKGNTQAGCTASNTALVELISPNMTPPPYGTENSTTFPCFDHLTMADLVTDWKYYAVGVGSIWTAPMIAHLLPSGGTGVGHV